MNKINAWAIVLTLIIIIAIIGGSIYWWESQNSNDVRPAEEVSITDTEEIGTSKPEIEIEPTVQPTESKIDKLNNLVTTLKVENPENFSYLGCGIIHGPDGVINNWKDYESNYLETLYSFLSTAASQYTLIKLDYSQNPNNVSDRINIVTCSCENYDEAKNIINDMGLNFPDLLWHTEDPKNDPMTPCLEELQFP